MKNPGFRVIFIAGLFLLAACGPASGQEPTQSADMQLATPAEGEVQEAPVGPSIQFEPADSGDSGDANVLPASDAPPVPDLSQIQLPSSFGELQQVNGVWQLGDQPVALVYQPAQDGGWDLWLTPADNPSVPMLIQSPDGTWVPGVKAWHAKITLIDLVDGNVHVAISSKGEDPLGLDLTPYEIFNISWLPPETYDIEFTFSGNEAFDLSCHIAFTNSSDVSFAALPVGVAVADANVAPQSGTELDIRTSPLCGN